MESDIYIGNHQIALEISFFSYGRQLGLVLHSSSSRSRIDTEIDSCDIRGSIDMYTQMLTAITIFGWAQAREQSGMAPYA